MLFTLSKFVGGYVRISGSFVLWVENDRTKIKRILEIFDEFPPITTRLRSQLAFSTEILRWSSSGEAQCAEY